MKPQTSQILIWTALPSAALIALALMQPPAAAPQPTPAPTPEPEAETAPEPAPAAEGLIQADAQVDRERVWAEDGTLRVSVRLRSTHDRSATARLPTDLVLVMDRSGSMSGEKLRDAKEAARALLAQLTPEDRFALVTYSGEAELTLPLQPVSAADQWTHAARITAILARGSTNMQAGLDLGLAQLEGQTGRARRIILLSDGLPDTAEGLLTRATRAATAEAPLTTVGIGNDYDEQLMSRLADAGTGNFYWVNAEADLAATFTDEFSTARETVAAAVEVQLHSPDGTSQLTEAGGYMIDQSDTFKVGTLYAGQDRRMWLTLRLDPAHLTQDSIDPGAITVRWRDTAGALHEEQIDLPPVDIAHSQSDFVAGLDAEAWGQGLVEEEYNRMRAEVSARVQAGDRAGAVALIDGYYDNNSVLNESVGSLTVADNLAEVQQLRAEVEATFTGDEQRERQNQWSKSNTMSAYSSRKVGQSKQY